MDATLLFLAGALVVLVLFFGAALVVYNGLVAARQECSRAWANIDVLLRQRHDEIPRLVEVCRGYMEYEREVLAALVEARSGFSKAGSAPQQAHASDGVSAALSRLFAVAEAYPDLRANESFAQLRTRITELENQIADRRELYNAAVTEWNTRLEQVPDLMVARVSGMKPRALWRAAAAERIRPPIKLAGRASD